MFIIHRCVTNNAGKSYLTIVANCREASLTLWGSHSTSTCNITFYFPVEEKCKQIVNYSLPPRKKSP